MNDVMQCGKEFDWNPVPQHRANPSDFVQVKSEFIVDDDGYCVDKVQYPFLFSLLSVVFLSRVFVTCSSASGPFSSLLTLVHGHMT